MHACVAEVYPMHTGASHMWRVISLCSQTMGYAYVVNVYTYAY